MNKGIFSLSTRRKKIWTSAFESLDMPHGNFKEKGKLVHNYLNRTAWHVRGGQIIAKQFYDCTLEFWAELASTTYFLVLTGMEWQSYYHGRMGVGVGGSSVNRMESQSNSLFIRQLFWGGHTQWWSGLLLDFHSRIIPGGTGGTIWDNEDRTQVSWVQGKCPIYCAITSAPIYQFSGSET